MVLPALAALLVAVGFWVLASVSPADLGRQALALLVALTACAGLVRLGPVRLGAWRWCFYLGSLALLVLVQLFGTEVNGARSWLRLGPLPGFQPSELTKLTLILTLAGTLEKRPLWTPLAYPGPLALIAAPVGLVLLEPDLGSALLIASVGVGMLLVRGVPRTHLLFALLVAMVALPGIVWPNLEPHQRARLVSFVQPDAEPLGDGYQVMQARIAVGPAGCGGRATAAARRRKTAFCPFRRPTLSFRCWPKRAGSWGRSRCSSSTADCSSASR